ncbi:hypothetical protein A9264_03270 [Vibrio sp. UCD-FRSSP16_10]|uniref:hypothetical protein n=1 Tax=unclassified Vibrio TaxID=2614977 RepID=UPI0008000FE4|nr:MULTISPECIES: hypothetical protein [unclassified Vibrio]OBT12170.1 hypothetical protein A9260_04720 [Vibrio sp. UCD-FRSSP16_30]OBT20501.1 hypothetical protein A9264_03270 [Vibrio sp. UCD-FRSSP16_10]
MRLAHKRKVQMKLQKSIKTNASNSSSKPSTAPKKPSAAVKATQAPVVDTPVVEAPVVATTVKADTTCDTAVTAIALTPKQQQVLDVVMANTDGINSKGIGLAAGQEESKAASWATGALKKLLTENLVQKEQLAGNKVIYKPA